MPTMPKQPDNPPSEVNTGLTESTPPQMSILQITQNENDQIHDNISTSKINKQTYMDVLYDEWMFKLKQEKVRLSWLTSADF